MVAHLGVPRPQPGVAPEGPWTGQPYFVVLGTVEPRKNHALLLRLWQGDEPSATARNSVPPDAHMLICGGRGWNNAAVFAALDARPARVHELPGLDDGQVAALLADSAGLLFPSLAEGFGLPPVEAAALGVPVLSAELPVVREVLQDIPVYAQVSDQYLWAREITRMAADRHDVRRGAGNWTPPGGDAHFKTVLTLI
ncbi:glycosyl transferase, group 1 [Citreicella sp. SE45]|nr:glycosyl transferase, group 1 [Citreicella sp. SE45]